MKAKGNSQLASNTGNIQNKMPSGGGGGGGGNSSGARGPDSKATPTAEQIRYAKLAQMSGQEDHMVQEKIKEVSQITGKSLETAAMALHDSNYDTSTAIQKLIDGDYDVWIEWTTTASKKKKPVPLGSGPKTPNEPTPETGPTVKDAIDDGEQKAIPRLSGRGGRGGRRGRSRKPDEREEKSAEGEDDIERDKERSLSERGHGRGKMQSRTQGRGRGRSAGYGGKGVVGRGSSRSRGRQPRRGRGRGGYGPSDHDGSGFKFEPENTSADSKRTEDWGDEQEDDKPTSFNWGEPDEMSAEYTKPLKDDWANEGGTGSRSLFSSSRSTSDLPNDSWKHTNGPQSNWLESKVDLKPEDSSYLPENVDGAVILSKRAPHTTTSEPTSYHSTSELSRTTYSSFQNNQFPSSNPEMSLASGFSKQTYQIESLLSQQSATSDKKESSLAPVISGIQDSRKLEQEQLQGSKAQRVQKPKRTSKSQPPCQPVEMPRSLMYELDSQLSGLQFGSSPLTSNAPQDVSHAVTTSTSASSFSSSSTSTSVVTATPESGTEPSITSVSQKPLSSSQYKSIDDFTARAPEVPRTDVHMDRSELSRTNARVSEPLQHDLHSGFLRQDDSRKEAALTDYSRPSTVKGESSRYNGVADIRESTFSQAIESDTRTHQAVQDIRRQTDKGRVEMHVESAQAPSLSAPPKSMSQRSEVPTERLGLTSEVSRSSYIPEVSRHRKPQEVAKPYSSPEAVRPSVLGDQLRYHSRTETRKQSPPLSAHDSMRQSLKSEVTRSSILPDMRHNLGPSATRRPVPQDPGRHDVASDVSVAPLQSSLTKSEKPKTPPGLSSLQERGGPNVYTGSPSSRDVSRLVTTSLSMVTSTLSSSFGSVSRGPNMAYASSSMPTASNVPTPSVMATVTQSVVLTGTSSFSSNPLTTMGYTVGGSTQSSLKNQTSSGKSSGPPGMMPLGMIHNVQQGLLTHAFPHQAIPYHYDEMPMMPRMHMSPYYQELVYPQTAGNARDTVPNPHTFQGNEGKYVRDNSSPVASSISQGTPHAPHPQATMFAGTHAHQLFGYATAYYPPGVIPGSIPVFTTAPVFPMGGSKVHVTNQYQSGYGAQPGHGYSSGEFSKTSYHSSVGQVPHKTNQGAASLTSGTSATDSVHHTTGFKVQDTKSYVNGTPPPPLGMHVPHGQSHPGSYPPQYMMQHASMLPTQPIAHHQMDSSSQSVHSARGQQHLGIGGSQSSKGKSQGLW